MSVLTASVVVVSGSFAHGNDVLVTVVNGANATNGKAIAAFAYDPVNDRMLVTNYGSSPFSGLGAIRLITNVSSSQTATDVLSEGQLQLYYRNNDTNRSVTTPLISGFLFNPQTVGSFAPYTMIWATDASLTRLPSSTTVDPAATKRFYRFDPSVIPDTYPVNAITTLTTLSDLQNVVNTSNTSSNWGRQFAWSNDGQRIYHMDTSTAFGGVWKLNPLTGQADRLVAVSGANTEVAVLNPGGGVDRIVFRGTGPDEGGLVYIDHDASTNTTSSIGVLLSRDALKDFLDQGDVIPTTFSATSDSQGNLYFNSTNGTGTVMRLDPQGRLVTLVNRAQRQAFLNDSPNSNTLRMQVRQIVHTTAGTIQQLLYAENKTQSVTGINIYKVGDFDRNGLVDSADRAMFLSALTPRGTPISSEELSNKGKYDLNGNGSVDWKDVKILQSFLGFQNGDVNLDGALTLDDLDILGANYYTLGGSADKTWAQGDIASLDPLATVYNATAADANLVNAVDVNLFAHTWLNVLGFPHLTLGQVDSRGYTGQFRLDVMAALVPEPGMLTLLGVGMGLVLRRRRGV
mgnify:CR=1 FL=1|jgi:hypothetical protein